MADIAYARVSTDAQSTDRQTYVLAESGVTFAKTFSDPAMSSRVSPLDREGFKAALDFAREGDTIHISEMFRLVRSVRDVLDVLDLLHARGLRLRVHSGAFSAIDLTARNRNTGEIDATVKMFVQVLAATGEFFRDLQRESTIEGVRAAEAAGNKGGRRAALSGTTAEECRKKYSEGASIASLAKEFGVSRGAVRTALGDLIPKEGGTTPAEAPTVAPEPVHTITMRGAIFDFLSEDETSAGAIIESVPVKTRRYGKGYSAAVTATAEQHRELLDLAGVLADEQAENSAAERKAFREYETAVNALP